MDSLKSINSNIKGSNLYDLSARQIDRRSSDDISCQQLSVIKSDVNNQSVENTRATEWTPLLTHELNQIVQDLDKDSHQDKSALENEQKNKQEGAIEQLLVEIDKQ